MSPPKQAKKVTKSSFARLRNRLLMTNNNRTAAYKTIHNKIRIGLLPPICKIWIHEIETKESRPKASKPNLDMPRYDMFRTPEQRRLAHMRTLMRRSKWAKQHRLKLKQKGLI